MSEAKFTPCPGHALPEDPRCRLCDLEAINADLYAALEASRRFVHSFCNIKLSFRSNVEHLTQCRAIEAALAKARGEKP